MGRALLLIGLAVAVGCGKPAGKPTNQQAGAKQSVPRPVVLPTAATLDINDPGQVAAYCLSWQWTDTGNVMVDGSADEQWARHRARVEGKKVRWRVTVQVVHAHGGVEVDPVYWPNPDYERWAANPDEDPRDLYSIHALNYVGKDGYFKDNDFPRGFRATDEPWLRTLKRGSVVVLTGTVDAIVGVNSKTVRSGGRERRLLRCTASIPDGMVERP
jgi:hypothetical protein